MVRDGIVAVNTDRLARELVRECVSELVDSFVFISDSLLVYHSLMEAHVREMAGTFLVHSLLEDSYVGICNNTTRDLLLSMSATDLTIQA